jgi:Fe-S cluster assembly ATP-binding protein
MLKIEDLSVEIEGTRILNHINLHIGKNERHVIFGPNGAGKSSLLMTIMGYPKYKVVQGRILFKDMDITHLSLDERAKMGIGMMHQRPPTIKGLTLMKLMEVFGKEKTAQEASEKLKLNSLLNRDINCNFSGGEIKRSELFQLFIQNPDLFMLDEPESGVDLGNVEVMGNFVNELLEENLKIKHRKRSALIITHTGFILRYVTADKGYVMVNGSLIGMGNPLQILKEIEKHGFDRCAECLI